MCFLSVLFRLNILFTKGRGVRQNTFQSIFVYMNRNHSYKIVIYIKTTYNNCKEWMKGVRIAKHCVLILEKE